MVPGIKKFKEYFNAYTGQYTFIGGAACDILLGNMGEDFRATKDLDVVLLIETLSSDFVDVFISFVEDGGYEHIDKGTGEDQFYRFSRPKDAQFPYMIELFSRKPDYISTLEARLAPIHISEDAMSLSAILLDEEYYELLKAGITVIDEVSVLGLEYIILFKIKAWLDLSDRKSDGESIDSKNIKKHKNDIFRLAANIEKDASVNIAGRIKADVIRFIAMAKRSPVDLRNLRIKKVSYEELLETIAICFGIGQTEIADA